MPDTREWTCPYCGFVGSLRRLSKHLWRCDKQFDHLVTPTPEVIAADAAWFAEHPMNRTLRRRIIEAEKVVYRERNGLAADVPLSGCVTVTRHYPNQDPRACYSYRSIRVEGVSGDAEGN